MPNVPKVPAPPGFSGCSKCGAVKPVSEFHKRTMRSGAVKANSWCKTCRKGQIHAWTESSLEGLTKRFWAKVNKDGPKGCWLWTGSKNSSGRGQIFVGGKLNMDLAHRVSLRLHGVEVPDRWTTGLVVDHMCKNGLCVNPAHLRIVTQAENCVDFTSPSNPFYRNKARTECVHGHPFSPENTYIHVYYKKTPSGALRPNPSRTRICLTCVPSYRKLKEAA